MTTSTATRADRLPECLCWIAAHGDCPGGLAWKSSDGCIYSVGGTWQIGLDLTEHWGESLVAIPRTLATTTKNPAITAWAQSSINQEEN